MSLKKKMVIALVVVPSISALAALCIVKTGALKTSDQQLYTPIPKPTSNLNKG